MSEHLTQTQIEDYGRRPLLAAELLFVVNHLGACAECRLKVEEAVDDDEAFLALKSRVSDLAEERVSPTERTHLTFEQMAGFVDGAIAGEELQVITDHLTCCEECETAVDDLRAFKDQIAPEIEREDRRSRSGAATGSRWRRLVAALSSIRPKLPVPVLGPALAAILLAATGWLAWQGWRVPQEKDAKPRIAVTLPSPSVSPVVSPTAAPGDAAEMFIARLNDSEGQVSLDREGRLSGLDHLPPADRRMVESALSGRQVKRSPLLAGLIKPGIAPRGDDEAGRGEFSVIEPVGTVTLSDRPAFRWSRLDGAEGYVVEIYDRGFNLVMASPQIVDLSWAPAESLEREGIYSWQVKAIKDGRAIKTPRSPAPQAKFRILDEGTAAELARARRTDASSHLTLGLLYARAGLLDDAERELRALQKANPDSAIPRRLLRRVREMRRVHSS